jgi:hypothetical protein
MVERILICGAGALGSQIAMLLASPEREFVVVDRDVVEADNLRTSVYLDYHVGSPKAVVLSELLYRKGSWSLPVFKDITEGSISDLVDRYDLVVDAFDNVAARRLTEHIGYDVLHAGVTAERTGIVQWGEDFPIPAEDPEGEDLCTHELGVSILSLTAAWAAHLAEFWLAENGKAGRVINLVF